jgi:hypothetical protein
MIVVLCLDVTLSFPFSMDVSVRCTYCGRGALHAPPGGCKPPLQSWLATNSYSGAHSDLRSVSEPEV